MDRLTEALLIASAILALCLLADVARAEIWGYPLCQPTAQLAGVLAHVDKPKRKPTVQHWHRVVESLWKKYPYAKQARHQEVEEAEKIVDRLASHGYDAKAIAGLALNNCSL